MRISLLAKRWATPEGAADGMAIAVSYFAEVLEALGHTVTRSDTADFTADLIITTIQSTWHRVASAAHGLGALDRVVIWHHHGGLPERNGCRIAGAVAGCDVYLPPSSWAADITAARESQPESDGQNPIGSDVLVPGCGLCKGGHVARAVAERCPDLTWYVLRGRCSNEDVWAWRSLPAEVAPGVVPPAAFLARTRAVLAPTRYETYGLTMVEAAVRGIPVVCTDTPELRASLGASAIYVPVEAAPPIWAFALRQALASPLPRLVLPPYREVVQQALEQLGARRAA